MLASRQLRAQDRSSARSLARDNESETMFARKLALARGTQKLQARVCVYAGRERENFALLLLLLGDIGENFPVVVLVVVVVVIRESRRNLFDGAGGN